MRGRLRGCKCERTLDEQPCIIYNALNISHEVYAYCCKMRNVFMVGVGLTQLPRIRLKKTVLSA